MKKKIIFFSVLVAVLLCLCSCTNKSILNIRFIDVGQGDSALIECDGHYMLIDGGDKAAGNKVYNVLEEKGIQHLDILALSHMHGDHIGGLPKALTYASQIDVVIANTKEGNTDSFNALQEALQVNGAHIVVPSVGKKYPLGSAIVEVVDVSDSANNDSLVLQITHGENKFLFTGDIEEKAQSRISDKYQNELDDAHKIDLIKMPHHGSYTTTLYRFLRTFMPDYAVISVGTGNRYGHPDDETMNLLNSKTWKPEVFRTDKNGDICVRSDGKEISVDTEK